MRAEDELQKRIVKAARALGFLVIRIKNEGKRTPQQIAYEKAMGLHVGASDLACIAPSGLVLFLELKSPDGVWRANQKDFGAEVQRRGHDYMVVRDYDFAVQMLTQFLKRRAA